MKNNQKAIQRFKSCSRYIDDLLLIKNYDLMKEVMTEIYPKELVLLPDDNNGCTAPNIIDHRRCHFYFDL